MTIRVNGMYRVGHKLRNVFNSFRMVRCLLLSRLSSDFRLPTSVFRLPTSVFRLPTSDFRLPTSDFRLPIFRSSERVGLSMLAARSVSTASPSASDRRRFEHIANELRIGPSGNTAVASLFARFG